MMHPPFSRHFRQFPDKESLRVIIGAGEQQYEGWLATQGEELNLLCPEHWDWMFGERGVDGLLCEHVWEHLTEEEGREAARLCFRHLRPGGRLRCAVPDAYFPDAAYQRLVQPGGPGPAGHPAADHKLVYNFRLFRSIFEDAGFHVVLLEYCDEEGQFHSREWDEQHGRIFRSLRFDPRNQGGQLGFVSLILDAIKPE